MDKEEILYNEIYERTKDFGRTHFIKEIMRLQREIKELKEKYMKLEDKYIHNVSCCNEEDCDLFCENQELKDNWIKLKEYLINDINNRNDNRVVEYEDGGKVSETISPIYTLMEDKSKTKKEVLNKMQEIE